MSQEFCNDCKWHADNIQNYDDMYGTITLKPGECNIDHILYCDHPDPHHNGKEIRREHYSNSEKHHQEYYTALANTPRPAWCEHYEEGPCHLLVN